MTEKNPTPVVETTEPVTGTEEASEEPKKVEGIEESKDNLTMENIQKIIADSITANNKKYEELQEENNKKLEELQNENKKLLDEKNLAEKINFLNSKGLDPTLIPFISNVPEEREEQAKILISVIEKAQLQALQKDMKSNPMEVRVGLNNNNNTPMGRNIFKFDEF